MEDYVTAHRYWDTAHCAVLTSYLCYNLNMILTLYLTAGITILTLHIDRQQYAHFYHLI